MESWEAISAFHPDYDIDIFYLLWQNYYKISIILPVSVVYFRPNAL